MQLVNQRIVLTGGTSGVGRALVQALHARGNRLVVVARHADRLQQLTQEYPDVVVLQANLAAPAEVHDLVQTLQRDFSDCSVLVNNAGIQFNYALGEDAQAPSRIASEVQVNLTTAMLLVDALLPGLRQQPAAAVLNITSGLGISPKRTAPVYCATKAGLQTFTKALRYQLEGTAVQIVDGVLPLVDTPMTAGRGTGKITPEQAAQELIRGVERGQTVVDVGKVRLLRVVHRLWPALADRMMK